MEWCNSRLPNACPELILTCPGYFTGEGIGTIYIPIKYCAECGRKLGK